MGVLEAKPQQDADAARASSPAAAANVPGPSAEDARTLAVDYDEQRSGDRWFQRAGTTATETGLGRAHFAPPLLS